MMNSKQNILYLLIGLIVTLASCSDAEEVPSKLPVTALPFKEISLDDLNAFRPLKTKSWVVAGNVFINRTQSQHASLQEGKGILISQSGTTENIATQFEHEDIDMELDFMMSQGSSSAVYLQGRYPVLLADSWRKDSVSGADCGAIAEDAQTADAPLLNACKAPGLWQHLSIRFTAPRFDAGGKKIRNAVFKEVVLNGQVIQREVEATGIASGSFDGKEKKMGPLMLAPGKGPVAFRNIQYKNYNNNKVALSNLQYEVYKGLYKNYDTLKNFQPARTGAADSLTWRVGEKKAQLVLKGEMNVPVDGNYLFKIRAGGPAWLFIDDKEVLDNDSTREYTIPYYSVTNLKSGKHAFKIIYANHDESLVLEYEGPDMPLTALTTPASERLVKPIPPLEYKVQAGPEFQRGFMQHKNKIRTYTMAVGLPGGLSYSYDLNTFTPLSVWRGCFIDVSNMWEERGESQRAIPLGAIVEFAGTPSLVQLNNPEQAWPDTVDAEMNIYANRGYKINDNGLPVFLYAYQGLEVEESLGAAANGEGLNRSLSFKTTNSPKDIYFQLGSGKNIEALPTGGYAIDDKSYYIEGIKGLDVKQLSIVKTNSGLQRLVVQIPSAGNSFDFSYSIVW